MGPAGPGCVGVGGGAGVAVGPGGSSVPEEWGTSASHLPACPRGGAGRYMVPALRAIGLSSKCENWRFLIELPVLCTHRASPFELNAVPFTAPHKSPAHVV